MLSYSLVLSGVVSISCQSGYTNSNANNKLKLFEIVNTILKSDRLIFHKFNFLQSLLLFLMLKQDLIF